MPTLYIANKNYSSWSLRPWVLLRELGIAFEEKIMPFHGGAFTRFSPSGKVPCLTDGATTVWDSLAITEYLAEAHPGVWPADKAARAFARCAAAEMHSGFMALRTQCGMNCGIRVKLRRIDNALKGDLARLDALWNDGLQRFGGPFLAGGRFTAADAFFAPVAFRIQTYAPPLDDAANAYAQRLLALPSMQDWYRAALAETWRDAAHDAEVAQWGTVTEDLRASETSK
ncbi:MAG: glutathione S-transferase family protein [Xanthomonadales bacterium]|nr:glutathione S-transferase family protein [Xanthomonadales bacterium]ODU95015.1 MAG: glutathione S-transferase [Rhodanobacter sp. SCN 66-43]OJY82241.1 MAG: glutathione S-transferase [Xanthomonadales bacterium 66-474]